MWDEKDEYVSGEYLPWGWRTLVEHCYLHFWLKTLLVGWVRRNAKGRVVKMLRWGFGDLPAGCACRRVRGRVPAAEPENRTRSNDVLMHDDVDYPEYDWKRGSKRFKWSRKDLEKLGLRGCLALPWFDDEFWLSSELPDSQLSTAESWDLLFLKINISRIGTQIACIERILLTGSGISGNACSHDPMLLQLSSRRRAPLKWSYEIWIKKAQTCWKRLIWSRWFHLVLFYF